jgi:predicted transposase/invertase (TIGR01784 family)
MLAEGLFVTKLAYSFKNDVLFKMVFMQYPELLKRLITRILCISLDNITEFVITNSEMPPDVIGEKFCRLDINMKVNGQRVNLEVQLSNEGDYTERSLYHWAREYSSALIEGDQYRNLPRVIIISILAFKLFKCPEFHSEYQPLEVKRLTPLNDKMCMHYFELSKLPEVDNAEDELKLWLTLFKAETEEDLAKIEALGVPVMSQAIEAYRHVSATDAFKEIERLRSRTRHNEASALGYAERQGAEKERQKWQGLVADKDAALADKDAKIADKDAALADKDAKIAELLARLSE